MDDSKKSAPLASSAADAEACPWCDGRDGVHRMSLEFVSGQRIWYRLAGGDCFHVADGSERTSTWSPQSSTWQLLDFHVAVCVYVIEQAAQAS